MKDNKKYKLSYDETRIIIMSLIELRNKLLEEGRYTDAVDDIISKLVNEFSTSPSKIRSDVGAQ